MRFGLDRVMGYYRRVEDFNIAKRQEYKDRKMFDTSKIFSNLEAEESQQATKNGNLI